MFIDGDVPVAPYPDWSQSDTALASIARLLRGLHDAARGFDPQGLTWDDSLADPAGGTLVCHNDVEPSNVVFRDGIAVALLDFEFAAPGRPVYDVAQLARPVCRSMTTLTRLGSAGGPPTGRHGDHSSPTPTDSQKLQRPGSSPLLTTTRTPSPASKQPSGCSVDAGDAQPGIHSTLDRTGGIEKNEAPAAALLHHHDQFVAALL